jgi:hypothetical protein
MTQHAGLDPVRWSRFTLDQQVLMIANEMNRARKLMTDEDRERRLDSYARILQLTDLTVQVQTRSAVRRELLRWRDLVAELYLAARPDPSTFDAVFRCLLQFTPAAHAQIQYLLPEASAR